MIFQPFQHFILTSHGWNTKQAWEKRTGPVSAPRLGKRRCQGKARASHARGCVATVSTALPSTPGAGVSPGLHSDTCAKHGIFRHIHFLRHGPCQPPHSIATAQHRSALGPQRCPGPHGRPSPAKRCSTARSNFCCSSWMRQSLFQYCERINNKGKG